MAGRVTIPQALAKGFILFVSLPDNSRKTIAENIGKLKTLTSVRELEEIISPIPDLSPSDSGSIASFLLGTAQLQSSIDVEADELVDAITNGLADDHRPSYIPATAQDHWTISKSTLLAILHNSSISYLAKAQSLIFEREHILTRSRILTDLRPVFDNNDTDISLVVALSTLHIEYIDGDDRNTISLAVDRDDLESLKSACMRALKKLETVNNKMHESGIAITRFGDHSK